MFLVEKKHGVYLEWYDNKQLREEHDYVAHGGKKPVGFIGLCGSVLFENVFKRL